MNFQHLFYFYKIAKHSSVSGAAKELSVSQPSLSIQLKQLEEYIGKPLFVREAKSLKLSQVGTEVLKYANVIFRAGNELENFINLKKYTYQEELRLGAMDSIPKTQIYSFANFCLSNFDTHIFLDEGGPSYLNHSLIRNDLDLIYLDHPELKFKNEEYVSRKIGEVSLNVYGSRESSHLKKSFPESLNDQNFVLPSRRSQLRHEIDAFFAENNIQPNVILETQDTSIQKLFAVESNALVFEPESAVKRFLKSGELIKIGDTSAIQSFYLCAKASNQSEVVSAILEKYRI